MKAKAQSDQLYSILDAVFEGVNNSQARIGSGKSFSYELKAVAPTVTLGAKEEAPPTVYSFTAIIREMGHGERSLQTIQFAKEKGMDKFLMEVTVLMSMLTIFTEGTLLQWDMVGKMMNEDKELQETAKKV